MRVRAPFSNIAHNPGTRNLELLMNAVLTPRRRR
jgi:hypothetical protein